MPPAGALKPLYNYINDLPALEESVTPFLPGNSVRKTIGNVTTFDAGRGCPFQCSFCTIINVQGRKSRRRSPDDVERILRKNFEHGIDRFFITDDNFARNKDWEPIFDRIIKLREQDGMDVRFLIQVDTLCHKIPNFVAKAKRAGVTRIFIGLENINPDNLLAAKKRQNKITEYRNMLLEWKAVGIWTYAGYILGFPNDTPESARRDIEIIKKEMPLDVLEFFFLTPLPGSEDHKVLWTKGAPLDPDLNKYDLEHALTPHAHMSKAEWEKLYRDSWEIYYTPEHIETILRRAQAYGINILRLAQIILWFAQSLTIEKVHPLQGGFVRLKARHERRPELPLEPALDILSGARLGDAGQARPRGQGGVGHFPHLPQGRQVQGRAVQRPGDAAGERGRHLDARAVHPQPVGARRGRSRPQGQDADRRRGRRNRGLTHCLGSLPSHLRESGTSRSRHSPPGASARSRR